MKHLQWSSLLPAARQVRPHFLHDPTREICVYRDVLCEQLDTPYLYAAGSNEPPGCSWLVLERVAGEKLCHTGELEVWQEAARWLADAQAKFSPAAGAIQVKVPLLRHDRAYYLGWLARASAASTSQNRQGYLSSALRCFERIIPRLADSAQSVIHGEFYASNILVRADRPAGKRICPVDWEMAAIGPALTDLAALTAGNWRTEDRMQIEAAYHRCRPLACAKMTRHEIEWLLDACRLALAIQWIGWSDGWTPPSDQAHDWYAEAVSLVRCLDGGIRPGRPA
ncbi:phosphotransferase [Humisphaera borealis]|uniref:Phosphotransferase n=1 Tax=Humisphaera borealis TaxID=2807512 RepID=A0A7M2WZA1_9BACT|nr:phosphotransferase [Humisphaera borealis]QOV90181.1 phosphotransferase [Humisphaera borealis]